MWSPATRPPRRARLASACAALAVLGTLVVAPSAAAVPRTFWGVVPQAPPSAEQLQRLRRGGVESIRVPISWGSVQPDGMGEWNWSDADTFMEAAAAARLYVLPFLSTAPSWAVPVDPTVGSPWYLPVRTRLQRVGWGWFVIAAVHRYGPGGEFWTEHPELPARPIRLWQLWNEPNFKYFVGHPNPIEYGKLLRLTYSAVRHADPHAKLILGGMFSRPIEATYRRRPRRAYFAADFLEQMYRHTPGARRMFQGIALHPYTGSYKSLAGRIGEVRRVLWRNHDARKPLFITELGWSSEPPQRNNSFAKGLRGQARELWRGLRMLRENWRRWRLRAVYWFSITDYAGLCNFCGGAGLFYSDFRPKPAWFRYVRLARGR